MSNLTSSIACHINPQYMVNIEQYRDSSHWVITFVGLTLNGASSIVALFLNLLILVGILTSPKKRTPTFILLANLALADFLIGITIGLGSVLPFVLNDFEQVCTSFKVYGYMGIFLGSSSLYTLTCISYDRYLSMQMHTKYQYVVTSSRTYKTTIAVWLVSLISPFFFSFLGKLSVAILISCIQVLCLLIIMDCYLLCFQKLKSRQKEIKKSLSQNNDIRSNRSTSSLAGSNTISPQEINKISPVNLQSNNDASPRHFDMISLKDKDGTSLSMISSFKNLRIKDKMISTKNVSKEDLLSCHVGKAEGDGSSENARSDTTGSETLKDAHQPHAAKKELSDNMEDNPDKVNRSDNAEIVSLSITSNISCLKSAHKASKRSNEYEETKRTENMNDNDQSQLSEVKRRSDDNDAIETQTKRAQSYGINDTISAFSQRKKEIIFRKKARKLKKRRPQSLLQDIQQFRKSLNTILIIVVALVVCYVPFLATNILAILNVMPVSLATPWYFLALNFIFFHSCISPVVLCVRIGRVQNDCLRVLKKIWCCRPLRKH